MAGGMFQGGEGMDMSGMMDKFGKDAIKMAGNMGEMNMGGNMNFGKDGMKMRERMNYQKDGMKMDRDFENEKENEDMEYAMKGEGTYYPRPVNMDDDMRRNEKERRDIKRPYEENEDDIESPEEEEDEKEVLEKVREWMSENGWRKNAAETEDREEMLMAFLDKLKELGHLKGEGDNDVHRIRFKGTLAGEFYASASEVDAMVGKDHHNRDDEGRDDEGMKKNMFGNAMAKVGTAVEKVKKVVSTVKDKVTSAKNKVKSAVQKKKNKKNKKNTKNTKNTKTA